MKIRLLALGTRLPVWINTGYQDYAKRMPRHCQLELQEIPLAKRSQHTNPNSIIQQESEALLARLAPQDYVVALDVKGEAWDTFTLAQRLSQWQMAGKNVSLLVGGPDGLAPTCLQRANCCWSLSPLTLPHGLVRIIVAEQLYRAISLQQGHPYHR
ncbi:MAG: 23S rRNA (pseudouridine(1915)-N(3))-methyltransferase RlmH [Gammaproteobacteria bacterium]